MRKFSSILTVLTLFLITGGCKEDLGPGCFNNSPLETIPWAKDELARFQRPRSGPLQVTIYSYKKEQFLAFQGGFLSSPMSHIFDCSGRTIAQRGINYNEFYDKVKTVKILLVGKY